MISFQGSTKQDDYLGKSDDPLPGWYFGRIRKCTLEYPGNKPALRIRIYLIEGEGEASQSNGKEIEDTVFLFGSDGTASKRIKMLAARLNLLPDDAWGGTEYDEAMLVQNLEQKYCFVQLIPLDENDRYDKKQIEYGKSVKVAPFIGYYDINDPRVAHLLALVKKSQSQAQPSNNDSLDDL